MKAAATALTPFRRFGASIWGTFWRRRNRKISRRRRASDISLVASYNKRKAAHLENHYFGRSTKMHRALLLASAFLMAFAFQGFAQNPPGQMRIGIINSAEFADEKTGITRYVSTLKSLNAEFTPTQTELRTMN